jgi:hypothetical protein
VGVLAENDVWLYDPAGGVPVVGPEPDQAATLRQVAADPALVDAFRLNGVGYRFSGRSIQRARIWLAYEPARLISRTRVLMNLAEAPTSLGRLYRDYVVDYRRWMRALARTPMANSGERRVQVDVWRYPFEVHGRTRRATATQPTPSARTEGGLAPDRWRRRDLLGAPEEARSGLVEMLERGNLTETERQAAHLFIAECDLDAGRFERARTALATYLQNWPTGPWRDHARLLSGRAAERLGQNDEALQAYGRVAGPRALRAQWLARRLRRRTSLTTRPAASP